MSEVIRILGEEQYDKDKGTLISGSGVRDIAGCVIDTAGQSKVNGFDVSDGNTDRLRVLAPAGTKVSEGESVEIRGIIYRIAHIPFDYSVGRRPVLHRHRPRTMFIAERKEG